MYKKVKPYLLVFLIGFVTSMFIILPYIIKDGGYFLISNDFNAQEIPINILANRAIKSGDVLWNWQIDLGSDFVSSLGFYILGSPFFYITLPFKPEAFPYVVGWVFMLKYAFAAMIAFVYFRRYLSDKSALIASLLYTFSGFQATNTVFYHFHEVVAFFPLMLIGIDKLMIEKKKFYFLISVFLNCFLNYYFFIAESIFCIIYYLIRFCPRNSNKTNREFYLGIVECSFEAIIGVLLTGVLLYPQIVNVIGNSRASKLIDFKNNLFYPLLDYFFYLRSLFVPADNMYEMPIIYQSNWTSFSLYLPMFSCSLALAYIFNKEKSWLKEMLIICFVFSLFPILNNIFVLFTSEVMHRWFYMFILLLSLASGKVLDDLDKYNWKLFTLLNVVVVIVLMVTIRVSSIDLFHYNRYLFLTFTGIFGPLLTYLLLRFKDIKLIKNNWHTILVSLVCVFSIVTTIYVIRTYRRTYSFNTDMTIQDSYNELMYSGKGLEESLPYRYSFWEYYKNRSMINNISTRSSFLSTVSSSIIKMYDNLGEKRFSNVSPGGPDGTNELFSIRYYIRPDNEWKGHEIKTYSNGYFDIHVYESDAYLPIGFTYDNYIPMSEFLKIKRDYRGFVMLKSLVIPDEKEDIVSQVLRKYDEIIDGKFVKDNVKADIEKHSKESSKNFSHDTHGFTCDIDAKDETYAFFSVPYEKEWVATVNNQQREILDINGLMAVRLDSGSNNISFEYQPIRLKTGLIISIVGAILCIAYFIYVKQKNRVLEIVRHFINIINKNIIAKGVSIFVLAVILAMLFNTVAFILPTTPIHKHASNASDLFVYEGSFPATFDNHQSSIYDNNTDAWMLLLAEYDGEEPLLQKALMGYYSLYTLEPSGLIGSMNIEHINDGGRLATNSYPRYWHGWILPLRLLLQVFDYRDIRAINYFVLVILITSIVSKMVKNNIPYAILPFVIGLLFIVPITSAMCMSYFEITFLMLVSVLLILCKAKEIKNKIGFPLFFMIIGICLGYFDFLTFPVITLGMPMLFIMLVNEQKDNKLVDMSLIKFLIICSITWAIGYIGMWSMKWVVASIFTDTNVILDAINQILYRTSGSTIVDDRKINFLWAIRHNLSVYVKKSYLLLIIITAIYLNIRSKNKTIVFKHNTELNVVLLLLAMLPFAWWAVTANHSYIHRHFTCKSIALSVTSLIIVYYRFLCSRSARNR